MHNFLLGKCIASYVHSFNLCKIFFKTHHNEHNYKVDQLAIQLANIMDKD